jgi:hypothetical protein
MGHVTSELYATTVVINTVERTEAEPGHAALDGA